MGKLRPISKALVEKCSPKQVLVKNPFSTSACLEVLIENYFSTDRSKLAQIALEIILS